MAWYINPKQVTKELWLQDKATKIKEPPAALSAVPEGQGLIDNGPFRAAMVCDERDLSDLGSKEDGRPKTWWIVKKELLKGVC